MGILEEHLERHPGSPWVRYYLGRLTYGEEALENLRAARDDFQRQGMATAAFEAQLNLARKLEVESKLDEAESELERAATMLPADARYAGDQVRLVEAALMTDRGDLDDAWATLAEIEGRVIPGAPDELRDELFSRQYLVNYQLGRNREAAVALERSKDINRALGYRYRQALVFYNTAAIEAVQSGEEDRERVIELFREALSVAEEVGRASVVARANLELARLSTDREAALGHLERCIELQVPSILPICLGALAFEQRHPDPDSARRNLDRALAMAEEEETPWPSVYLWADRMPVTWATRPRDQAIEDSLESLKDIEAVRESELDDATSAQFFSVWAVAYTWLAGKLLTTSGPPILRPDLELAFDVTERFRARVLLENLQQAGAWPDLGEEDRDRVRAHPTEVLERVEEALRGDEAMLAYQLGDWRDKSGRFAGGSWLFAVHRGGSEVYRLDEVPPLVGRLEPTSGSAEGLGAELAEEIYDALLRRAIEDLPEGVDKLWIVPDGALHQLPFGSLGPFDGVPLAVSHEISLIPSANLWLRWRRQAGEPQPGPALVLADPAGPEQTAQGSAGGARRTARDPMRRACRQLPFARQEGEAILKRTGRSSVLLIGEQASEGFLKRTDLRQFGVIHVASHAFVDNRDAERSMVCLAPGGQGEDGYLRVREIVNLDLDNQLVVLAACDSASGPRLAGEGVMSLARAFFLAGARAVVGTLKGIDDADAKDFFVRYHGHLADGLSTASALRATKREIYEELGPEAVYGDSAWTNVVVLGDGSIKPLRAEATALLRSWLFWAAVGLMIYLVSIGIRVWLQRR